MPPCPLPIVAAESGAVFMPSARLRCRHTPARAAEVEACLRDAARCDTMFDFHLRCCFDAANI